MSRQSKIFISYRRNDSGGYAGRLNGDLIQVFSKENVFYDIETLNPGESVKIEDIEKKVGLCDVLLAVIGGDWLAVTKAGARRIDDPKDYVRREIATALKLNIVVIPVIVPPRTEMPGEEDLPDELKPLTKRQALILSQYHWSAGSKMLVERLKEVLGQTPQSKVELNLNLQLSEFDEKNQRLLRYAIAAFLEIAPSAVQITSIKRSNSIKVSLKIPEKSAEKLLNAHRNRDPELDEYFKSSPLISLRIARRRPRLWLIIGLVTIAVVVTALAIWFLTRQQSLPPPSPALKSFTFDVVKVDAQGREKERLSRKVPYFTEDLGGGVTLDMVQIPGGTFRMGSSESEVRQALEDAKLKPDDKMFNNELPQHEVTVSGFFMSKFEVTQAQWQAVKRIQQVKRSMDATQPQHTGDNLPVEQVWWEEATEFCERLSKQTGRKYRLPTEAEWEYACRAGTTTPFTFGETITPDLANYDSGRPYGKVQPQEYQGGTLPVGWFRVANGFGLYDMPGNVKEWCQDGWHEDYTGAPTKGGEWWSQSSTSRVARGGGWLNDAFECRCAFRDGIPIDRAPRNNVGFRVVMVVEQP